MGEEETLTNGVTMEEQKVEDILQKKGEDKDGGKETEEDAKDEESVAIGAQEMDVDPLSKEDKETIEVGKENTGNKQEEEVVKNELTEEKKEELETDPVSKEDNENGSKQEEEEMRQEVTEEKKRRNGH